jgi:hypothetical protein
MQLSTGALSNFCCNPYTPLPYLNPTQDRIVRAVTIFGADFKLSYVRHNIFHRLSPTGKHPILAAKGNIIAQPYLPV